MFEYEELIQYASSLYEMKIDLTYSPDKTIMFLHTPFDDFKIYLKDKERFNYFTIAHKNHFENKGAWHNQMKCKDLDYAIYTCLVHGFNKIYNLWSEQEDYERFIIDARRAINYE